jgi:hypothetical protein
MFYAVLLIRKYFLRIWIRESVILIERSGSGSQLITDPARSRSCVDIFVAIKRIIIFKKEVWHYIL